MNITSVRVSKAESQNGKLLGYAGVVLNDAIAIHNIRIIQGENKRFLSFPSMAKHNPETHSNTYTDLVHPLNSETRAMFEEAIFNEFDKLD